MMNLAVRIPKKALKAHALLEKAKPVKTEKAQKHPTKFVRISINTHTEQMFFCNGVSCIVYKIKVGKAWKNSGNYTVTPEAYQNEVFRKKQPDGKPDRFYLPGSCLKAEEKLTEGRDISQSQIYLATQPKNGVDYLEVQFDLDHFLHLVNNSGVQEVKMKIPLKSGNTNDVLALLFDNGISTGAIMPVAIQTP